MSAQGDADLAELTAQVRAYPLLSDAKVVELLTEARHNRHGGAEGKLVEHHLGLAMDAALARHAGVAPKIPTISVGDLYQEGAVAVVVAVSRYVTDPTAPASNLRADVIAAIDEQLDGTITHETEIRKSDDTFVEAARVLAAVRVHMRSKLDRPATTEELATALKWTPDFVETVSAMVDTASALYDLDIVAYLDDAE